jgi:hypothetical protein
MHMCRLLASALLFVNTHVRHSCMYSDSVQARSACTCEVGQTTHEMGTQRMHGQLVRAPARQCCCEICCVASCMSGRGLVNMQLGVQSSDGMI